MQESIHKNATPFAKRSRPASLNLSRKNHDRIYIICYEWHDTREICANRAAILCNCVSLSVCAVIQSVNRITVSKKDIYTCNAVFRRFPPFSAVFRRFPPFSAVSSPSPLPLPLALLPRPILHVNIQFARKYDSFCESNRSAEKLFPRQKIQIRNRRKQWNKDKIRCILTIHLHMSSVVSRVELLMSSGPPARVNLSRGRDTVHPWSLLLSTTNYPDHLYRLHLSRGAAPSKRPVQAITKRKRIIVFPTKLNDVGKSARHKITEYTIDRSSNSPRGNRNPRKDHERTTKLRSSFSSLSRVLLDHPAFPSRLTRSLWQVVEKSVIRVPA